MSHTSPRCRHSSGRRAPGRGVLHRAPNRLRERQRARAECVLPAGCWPSGAFALLQLALPRPGAHGMCHPAAGTRCEWIRGFLSPAGEQHETAGGLGEAPGRGTLSGDAAQAARRRSRGCWQWEERRCCPVTALGDSAATTTRSGRKEVDGTPAPGLDPLCPPILPNLSVRMRSERTLERCFGKECLTPPAVCRSRSPFDPIASPSPVSPVPARANKLQWKQRQFLLQILQR